MDGRHPEQERECHLSVNWGRVALAEKQQRLNGRRVLEMVAESGGSRLRSGGVARQKRREKGIEILLRGIAHWSSELFEPAMKKSPIESSRSTTAIGIAL
jgi:hypothetical protein